ncbi:hypothetical protein KCMC57_up53180 [Kitasatospora sp. CMC57]|uniref:Uncharacterized protein n=1 Tax=Kitasatospora sp. CMC57 TaxID=3231513 RepID=A0AB33K901_9ACTN
MAQLSVPLIQGFDDQLLIPAVQVTALLRGLGEQMIGWTAENPALDPPTVGVLATVLQEVADQIDVECIDIGTP